MNEVCFFFFIFFLFNLTGGRHVRHDDLTIFFSDGYLPEFTKRQGFQFFWREKLDFFWSQIKHHNWPPIFLLEEQEIVPRSEPMLLPQPGLRNREESCGTYP